MNEEKELLLSVLKQKGLECKKYRIEELSKKTKIQYEKLSSLLYELEKEGEVYIDSNNLVSSFPPHLVFGKVKVNKNHSGSFSYNGKKYRIKKANTLGILNQDIIIGRPTGNVENGMELISVEKIVARNEGIIVGEVQETHGKKYIIDINNNISGKIIIPKKELSRYVNGDRLQIRIGFEKENDSFLGEVVQLIGHKDDPDLKIKSHLAKYNLKTGFSEEAIKEAEEANRIGITPELMKDREDLRRFNNISIDPESCKDRDDSFFLEKLNNNHKKVYINIVDITPWVYPGTAMWRDAEEKDASAYIYDTSEPMLPRPISNGIGSINENTDRLAETLAVEFDEDNDIVDFYLVPSIINTKKNCTYDDTNKLLEEGIVVQGYETLKNDIIDLNTIAEKVYDDLKKGGFLDFYSEDKEYTRDEKGKVIKVSNKGMGKSQKMVEAFMVLADSLIPHLIYLPAPYRNHAEPDSDIIKDIQYVLSKFGIKAKIIPSLDINRQLQIILKQIENHPLEKTITELIIKKMKKAYYSPNNIGHFGLSLAKYLQWTSPDRRFNDLILFHIIKLQRKLEKEDLTELEYTQINREIYEYLRIICERISYVERQIEQAERDSFASAVEEIKSKNNNLINAQITYLNSNLILLKTTEGQEGRLDIGNYFRYNKKTRSYIHKRYKFQLHVGNLVKVRINGSSNNDMVFEIPKKEAQRLSLTLK